MQEIKGSYVGDVNPLDHVQSDACVVVDHFFLKKNLQYLVIVEHNLNLKERLLYSF